MVIYEAEVPGVGKRYEIETGNDERLVVIVHHDGKRQIFRRDGPDADAEKLFDLSSKQAREAATVLEGADFQPLDLETADVPLGDAIMEWVEVPEESPIAGQTLRDAQVGERTGATVAAIQRDDETLASPNAEAAITPGDILVVIGSRTEQQAFQSLLETGQ
ncbi:cation:proton antiporter regulatory subunit [Haloarcula sp. JP-L23]|uniref:cation:proton antiporter regulatory subunit n=1 Tax=Haloarcula sp. JP-L23 TaxID=2716717 RepID=UPI00140EE143|nr:cation:proton antiporter regulatory subunit [Haloarcula sp. JP-L23]